jgi:hypothetical protein
MNEYASVCQDANRIAAQLRGRQPLKKQVDLTKYVRPSRALVTGNSEYPRVAARASDEEVLAFCRAFFDAQDQLPPQAFIAERFKVSEPTANRYMRQLGEAGFLEENVAGKWRFARKLA